MTKTATNPTDLRRKAHVLADPPAGHVRFWLRRGWQDFRANLGLSLSYGVGLSLLGWIGLWLMASLGLGWMVLPALAGLMLLGPLATVGLYQVSRGRRGVAAPGQIFLISVVMMVLIMAWVRAATILFAVFFGLRPFSGPLETLETLLTTPPGVALVLIGSAVGGLFAALGFAISAFSFPMLVDREIDGFSAMALSLDAVLRNFRLAVMWGACITLLIGVGLISALIGLILIFPLLGYATWHAYADLFGTGGCDD